MALSVKFFEALEAKTGLSRRQTNRLISQEAVAKHLPRNLAALSFAGKHGVAIHRFASDAELAELRGVPSGPHQTQSPMGVATRETSGARRTSVPKVPKATRNNSIFVVHGRDLKLRDDMYAFLRAIGINAMEWNDAIKAAKGGANPIVGDVISDAMKKVQGVMVLLSPDEDARLKSGFASDRQEEGAA